MSLVTLFGVIPYMVPTVVAAVRDHERKTSIFWLNLLLGWTIIGWIVALVWACSGPRAAQPIAAESDEATPVGLKLQGRDPRLDV